MVEFEAEFWGTDGGMLGAQSGPLDMGLADTRIACHQAPGQAASAGTSGASPPWSAPMG